MQKAPFGPDAPRIGDFVLASTSPRRRELLAAAGYRFDVHAVEVDESQLEGENAREYVERVAKAKARNAVDDALTLGADTVVVHEGSVLGKPGTVAEATTMLKTLRGRDHRVLTGWALSRRGEIVASGVVVTEVTFRRLSNDEVDAYVATGEPMDRAGAYAIQGGAGHFVAQMGGSFSNVMGLPMETVAVALAELGIYPATSPPPI